MIFLITLYYPNKVSKEIATIYASLPKAPDYVKIEKIYVTKLDEEKSKTYFFVHVDDDHEKEARTTLWELTAKAFMKVVGLDWKAEKLMEYDEKFKKRLLNES